MFILLCRQSFSGGHSFWGHTNSFSPSPNTAVDELLSPPLRERNTIFLKEAISSGRFSSKAMPHFSSSPRDAGTAWQCSFYQTPLQFRLWSLGQFGDPKLPSLVDWNPPKRGKPWAGFIGDHISNKYPPFEKSNSSFYLFSLFWKWRECGDQGGANCSLLRNLFKENELCLNTRDTIWCFPFWGHKVLLFADLIYLI